MRRLAAASIVALAVVLALAAAGCEKKKKPAAIVNGAEIPQGAVQWNLHRMVAEHTAGPNEPSLREAILDQLVGQKLMAQAAMEQGLAVDDQSVEGEVRRITQMMGEEAFRKSLRDASLSEDEFRQTMKDRLLAERFFSSLSSGVDVDEAEVKEFYEENPKSFLEPESVLIKFIQVPSEEQANRIMGELKEGKTSFDDIAERLREDKEVTVSAYGWAKPSFFSDEIAEALRSIEVGEYAGPFRSKGAYFMFRVKDRKAEKVKSYAEAKEEIRSRLLEEKQREALMQWLEEAKERADIAIN